MNNEDPVRGEYFDMEWFYRRGFHEIEVKIDLCNRTVQARGENKSLEDGKHSFLFVTTPMPGIMEALVALKEGVESWERKLN